MRTQKPIHFAIGVFSCVFVGFVPGIAGATGFPELGDAVNRYLKSEPTLDSKVDKKLSKNAIVTAAKKAQAPAAAPAAPAGPPAPTFPAMSASITANSSPAQIDAGPLGKIFVGGVVSGLGLWQNSVAPGDQGSLGDLDNGQVFFNKTSGLIQFGLQVGEYSLPSLGTPYLRSSKVTANTFDVVPQGYVKVVPNDNFSFMAGKLPTLVGAEYTFTYQNLNIERGLLWNQEPAVSKGVQANYAKGPFSGALSFTDGYYSDTYSWLTLSLADTLSKTDTVSLIGGTNTKTSKAVSFATPLTLNNSQIYNLIYTHAAGAWTVTPYLQFSNVPKATSIGINHSANTFGAALLANYAFTPKSSEAWLSASTVSIPVRFEYITSSGNANDGSPNLLYGPGSSAYSLTITPTLQYKQFFLRGELSYVKANSTTAGSAFGGNGTDSSQFRGVVEAGITF